MASVETTKRNVPREPRTLILHEGTYNATFSPGLGHPASFQVPAGSERGESFDLEAGMIMESEVGREIFKRPSLELSISSKNKVTHIKIASDSK